MEAPPEPPVPARKVRSRMGAVVVIICGALVIGAGLALWILLRVVDQEQQPESTDPADGAFHWTMPETPGTRWPPFA